jgi:hypothetical protein
MRKSAGPDNSGFDVLRYSLNLITQLPQSTTPRAAEKRKVVSPSSIQPRPVGMFERTLSDLIRGLRALSKKDEPKFISLAINEIRSEIRSKDMELKAAAVLKLTYVRDIVDIYFPCLDEFC